MQEGLQVTELFVDCAISYDQMAEAQAVIDKHFGEGNFSLSYSSQGVERADSKPRWKIVGIEPESGVDMPAVNEVKEALSALDYMSDAKLSVVMETRI